MTRATGRMLTMVERAQLVHCRLVRRLACGCDVAHYSTAAGRVLTVVESPEDSCPDRGHQADFVIDDAVDSTTFATSPTGEAA